MRRPEIRDRQRYRLPCLFLFVAESGETISSLAVYDVIDRWTNKTRVGKTRAKY